VGRLTILALRIVLVMALAGSVVVQGVMVPLLATDLAVGDFGPDLVAMRIPIVAIAILGVATIQVIVICVWRLLTMVRRGTVFSHAAFRYVDIVVGALGAACLLTFGLGVTLAPGETVPPGIVLLVGGAAGLIAGMALIVLVLRMLLSQAVARDAEARHLRSELDEVI